MSESIGIREGWIEKGWTEEQMMDRIKELNLPVPWCSYQPYVMNFLQTPDMNQKTLELVEESRKIGKEGEGTNAWIAASNLWTPNKPINIVFSSNTHQEYVKAVLLKYLQPNISMQLTFPGGSSGDIMINVASLAGQGGNSAVGRTGRQQTVNLGAANMNGADLNTTQKFHWPKYTVLHEFGHALGLWHEWNREMCGRNGVTCSGTQDSYSVMNYPAGSQGGASDAKPSPNCMDTYSPTDIEWLNKVYGKGPGGTQPPQPPSTGKPSTQKPQPTNKPQPPPKTQPPRPPPPIITQKPKPPPPIITQKPKPPPPPPTQPPPPPPTQPPPPPQTQPPTTIPGTTTPGTTTPGTTTPGTTTPGTTTPGTTTPGTTTPGTTTPGTTTPGTTTPSISNVNISGSNLNTIIIIVSVSAIVFIALLAAIVKFSKKN